MYHQYFHYPPNCNGFGHPLAKRYNSSKLQKRKKEKKKKREVSEESRLRAFLQNKAKEEKEENTLRGVYEKGIGKNRRR